MRQRGLKPDVISYSAAISVCEKRREWKRALKLLDEMRQRELEPNVISCSALISACGNGGEWKRAIESIRRDSTRGLELNVISYSAAISACKKSGDWERASDLLDEMRQRELKPDVILYDAAISACDKCGEWERALELLDEMIQGRLEPDVISYNAVISACELSDERARAMKLFREATFLRRFQSVQEFKCRIDAHQISVPVAKTAIRVMIADVREKFQDIPASRDGYPNLDVITGHGKGSEGGINVLRRQILAMVKEEYGGPLESVENASNSGLLQYPQLRFGGRCRLQVLKDDKARSLAGIDEEPLAGVQVSTSVHVCASVLSSWSIVFLCLDEATQYAASRRRSRTSWRQHVSYAVKRSQLRVNVGGRG